MQSGVTLQQVIAEPFTERGKPQIFLLISHLTETTEPDTDFGFASDSHLEGLRLHVGFPRLLQQVTQQFAALHVTGLAEVGDLFQLAAGDTQTNDPC
jgi:hypothetical protein